VNCREGFLDLGLLPLSGLDAPITQITWAPAPRCTEWKYHAKLMTVPSEPDSATDPLCLDRLQPSPFSALSPWLQQRSDERLSPLESS
jgi:hypothetical protein